jgi:hypothetical protein
VNTNQALMAGASGAAAGAYGATVMGTDRAQARRDTRSTTPENRENLRNLQDGRIPPGQADQARDRLDDRRDGPLDDRHDQVADRIDNRHDAIEDIIDDRHDIFDDITDPGWGWHPGWRYRHLPPRYTTVVCDDLDYYYSDGYWSSSYDDYYVVVAPPIGAVVCDGLPAGTERYTFNGDTYFAYADICYVQAYHSGMACFEVVECP